MTNAWSVPEHLPKEFKDVADRLGCHFIDAGSIPGIEMYPYDWMHLSLDSHGIFARVSGRVSAEDCVIDVLFWIITGSSGQNIY